MTAKIRIKEKKIENIKNLARKIDKNHLGHDDLEAAKKAMKELRKELNNL